MPYIVPIGNRREPNISGVPTSVPVNDNPTIVSIQCFCRSVPKIIELVVVMACASFTKNFCNPIIIHAKAYNTSDAVSSEFDETRSYLAFVTIFICMFVIVSVFFGYVIGDTKEMVLYETVLLTFCGILCSLSGGLILDAVLNHTHRIKDCSKEAKPYAIINGSLFIISGMVFFLDGFIAYQMQPTITPISTAPQQSVKIKHLAPKFTDVVYVSSKEKYKMDFAEDAE